METKSEIIKHDTGAGGSLRRLVSETRPPVRLGRPPQALQSPIANKGSCVRRVSVGTDRRLFGEVRTNDEAARMVRSDLPEGDSAM